MLDNPEQYEKDPETMIELTASIVSAYVSKNIVPAGELPDLIHQVHDALARTGEARTEAPAEEPQKPAVPLKKALKNEEIYCLECGKPHKSLKRHLASQHDLEPQEYREKWGLPNDYPMVAPAYAERRSKLAKQTGLGQKRQNAKE
ncbi:MucR family transcriptional regulator [Pararhizobium mangrovi]|uniref:MucR family transcriptional regulator n=1 Tax=Pararhizobium mangrovi TaxID=2590452 RepID=A0A506UB94_9HYPH|nr:MucR family transcriptional regulator [Pararhizobium mangrovi]TPW29889.1 MucR family transcriptional regulator [Pararhizobium mangrovi]